jgi:hypothetical protein
MAQHIHPTLFHLGWTKQSNHLWYSFQNSKYGSILIQDFLWSQSLSNAFNQIGFFTSDLFIQRTSSCIYFAVQIYPYQSYSHPIPSSSSQIFTSSIPPYLSNLVNTVPVWRAYNLCLEFKKTLELITGQPVLFKLEWIPTYYLSATLMAKQFKYLIEKKTSIKKTIDTVISSRHIPSRSSLILPDSNYGNLNWWIWITLNSLRTWKHQKHNFDFQKFKGIYENISPFFRLRKRLEVLRSYHRFSLKVPRIHLQILSWKETRENKFKINNKSPFILYKKRRITLFGRPLLRKENIFLGEFQYKSRLVIPRIDRRNHLSQYWIANLKIILQHQLWRKESFQIPFSKLNNFGDKTFQKSLQRYELWEKLSPSVLHIGDFILSSQFQIRQGRFCKYRLAGRLNGVDMAQIMKGQQGSYKDPYAIQMEQIGIQTPWGIYGLSITST